MDFCGTIIPVYASTSERLKYFNDCLKSITRQQYPTITIVVDDGSPKFDDVKQIFENNNNGSLRLVQRTRHPNDKKTASNAINYGIEKILSNSDEILTHSEMGKIKGICYLHSDDMFTKTSIEQRMNALKDKSVVYSNLFRIDSQSKPISKYGCGKKILVSCHTFPHHSTMWHIDFLKELKSYIHQKFNQPGLFDKNLCAGEDRDVTLNTIRFAKKNNYPIIFIDGPTYLYRDQKDSITCLMSQKQKSQDAKRINQKHQINPIFNIINRINHDLPWSLFTYLPESIKRPCKYPRDTFKRFFATKIRKPAEYLTSDYLINS
jgi:glycosyltransferase involved in cell wall biosynthesis